MKKIIAILIVLSALLPHRMYAEETIKLAFIDPLSGSFADVGTTSLHQFQFAVDLINRKGGVLGGKKLEVISFDSKGSALTTQRRLHEAINDGARVVLQGNSSHVAMELTQAIVRKNEDSPNDPVLFLNFSAADPALTNEACTFWHFRFDPHADMKVAALVKMLASHKEFKRVYLINQDYGFGHAVAEAATRFLRQERSDIEIVGNVFHPVGVVDDFKPYAQQIAQQKPDAVITGNWGTDIYRLVFAMDDLGLMTPMYTVNGGGAPISDVIGDRGNDRILLAHGGIYNPAPKQLVKLSDEFIQTYGDPSLSTPRIITTIEFLAKAIEQVGSVDILKIALAMEGMEMKTVTGNTVRMRSKDHQLIEPVRVSAQSDRDINLAMDAKGRGMREVFTVDADEIDKIPTSCRMKRPPGA